MSNVVQFPSIMISYKTLPVTRQRSFQISGSVKVELLQSVWKQTNDINYSNFVFKFLIYKEFIK